MGELTKSPDCKVCTFRSLLFQSLDTSELSKLNSCKTQYNYKKGELICREGDEIQSILYLHKGLVKLHKDIGLQKSQIVSIAKPFDFVGLLSVFSNNKFLYSLTAIEDSSVCFINKECFEYEIRSNGKFALDIIRRMSKITDDILESKFSLSKKNLRGRIAQILVEFSEHIYKKPEFDLPVSRKEIAELIDMRTENVIRILSEFRKDGIIKINGPGIEIIQPELLRKISDAG